MPVMQDPGPAAEDVTILDYLAPLLKWRWLIFCGVLLGGAVSLGRVLTQNPSFMATALFIPKGALGDTDQLSGLSGASGKRWDSIRSATDMISYYAAVFHSPAFVTKMLERKFNCPPLGVVPLIDTMKLRKTLSATEREGTALDRFSKTLEVGSGSGRIVTVSYTAPDAQMAADVVNAVLEECQKLPGEDKRAEAAKAFIKDNLDQVQEELKAKEEAIALARDKKLDVDARSLMALEQLERERRFLEDRLSILNAEYAKAEIRISQNKELSIQDIDVIIPATPPLRKVGMGRGKIVILSSLLSGMALAGVAIVLEYFGSLYRSSKERHVFWRLLRGSARDLIILGTLALLASLLIIAYYKGYITLKR